MKLGPLTFQWACFVCVCRSMQSASRALRSSTALTRVASGRSFLVLNMVRLLVHAVKNRLITPGGLTPDPRVERGASGSPSPPAPLPREWRGEGHGAPDAARMSARTRASPSLLLLVFG